MEFVTEYWWLVALVLLVALILLFLVFRPRQQVRLTDQVPVRPHMATGEGKGLADEAAAALSDVGGAIIDAKVHQELPGASGPPYDLIKLKGVGPKLAVILQQRGLTRFDQIAKLSVGQLEELDDSLGAFRGRLTRDKVVDQADYLARGDIDGFEARFGKL